MSDAAIYKNSFTGLNCIDRLVPKEYPSEGLHALLGSTGVGTTKVSIMLVANFALKALSSKRNGRVILMASQTRIQDVSHHLACYLKMILPDTIGVDTVLQMIDFSDINDIPYHVFGVAELIKERITMSDCQALVIDDFESLVEYQLRESATNPTVSRLMRSTLLSLKSLAIVLTAVEKCGAWRRESAALGIKKHEGSDCQWC